MGIKKVVPCWTWITVGQINIVKLKMKRDLTMTGQLWGIARMIPYQTVFTLNFMSTLFALTQTTLKKVSMLIKELSVLLGKKVEWNLDAILQISGQLASLQPNTHLDAIKQYAPQQDVLSLSGLAIN